MFIPILDSFSILSMRPLFIKQTKDYDVLIYLGDGLQRFFLTKFCMTM